MEFHRLKQNELQQCYSIALENFGEEQAKAIIAEVNANRGQGYYTLSDNGSVLACGAFTYSDFDDKIYEVHSVCVAKSEQRKGYGMELMKEMIKHGKSDQEIEISLMSCEKHLRNLYEKMGLFVLYEMEGKFLMCLKMK